MGAGMHGRNGHKSAGAIDLYEIPEQRLLGLGAYAELYRNGKFLGHIDHKGVVRLGRGQSLAGRQLRRPHPRLKEGEGITFTVPSTVVAAMKERGLLDTPQTAFAYLNRNAIRAMEELNRHAYGRTTEYRRDAGGQGPPRRVTKRVKVDLYYLVYRGFRTRAGEVSPQITAYVLNMGRAANGKFYALDWPPLYHAQRPTKAVWHMGVAYDLGRRANIKCVPEGHSFRALGIDKRVKPKRSRQMQKRLKKMRARGPEARAKAARETRAPKPAVSWAEAVKNFGYRVSSAVERVVEKLNRARQRRFARQSVRAAVAYCRDNSLRFSTRDVMEAAAHLSLPHVRPAVFVRAFKSEMARIEQLGVSRVKDFGNGQTLFTGAVQALAERKAVTALAVGTLRKSGRLSSRQVVKALAARGCDATELSLIGRLAGGGVTVDRAGLAADPKTLSNVVEAYRRNKRAVHFVGAVGGAEPGERYTAKEFVSTLTRTSHMVALWRGLRSPGSLMDKLTVAEHIRRAGRCRLKRGALVVADVRLTEAVELRQIEKQVRAAKGHLLVVGEGAKQLAPLVERHKQSLVKGVRR